MAVDIKTLFNEKLPGALARNADDARAIGATYQVNIIDEGEWFIDVSASGPACRPGAQGAADCTITIGADDFLKLLDNPQAHGMSLYSAGKLQITGDPMLALQLQKIFSYV